MQNINKLDNDNIIEVNLNNIKHNYLNVLKSKIKENTKVIAVVKSNAYGHGLIKVSQFLESINVDYLGVFSVKEGVILRLNGLKKEILIFGAVKETDIEFLFDYSLTPLIGTKEEYELIEKIVPKGNKTLPVHIKVDTGMGRIGFLPDESLEIIKKLYFFNKRVEIKGICTHFSDSSSVIKDYTIFQAELFQKLLDQLTQAKINIPIIHVSNSAAIINYPEFQFNCVRPGLLLYGLSPFDYNLDLKPALSLISKIITIKNIQTNSFLSYNRTFQTKRPSRIALVPLGYADGFSEKLSNKGQVIIRNNRYPMVGSICMNQFLVDITDSENIQYNDRVTIIGNDISESISVKEISKTSSLIPYEILCRLSEDLPRIYKE